MKISWNFALLAILFTLCLFAGSEAFALGLGGAATLLANTPLVTAGLDTNELLTKAALKVEKMSADQVKLAAEVDNIKAGRAGELARLQDIEQQLAGGEGLEHSPYSVTINFSALHNSESLQQFKAHDTLLKSAPISLDINVKALTNLDATIDTSNSGLPSRPDQIPGFHGYVLRPLRLINIMPSVPQSTNSFDYVRLSFTGDADVQDGEGEEKAQMDFDGELITGRVQTIAVHTTASAQVLDDNQQLEATINNILSQKALGVLETQLITGSGTGANIEGVFTAAPAIATPQNEVPDRIGYALTQMETTGFLPNAILMNPLDWFNISIMKDNEGNYLYGNPAAPAPPSLWNRPVITSPSIPAGTALIGDTTKAQVRDRMQATVFISRDHKDYRTRNLVLILVELRAGLAIFDAAAFRKVSLGPQT
jgi:HK97 family phage major capsid protein